MIYLTDVTLIDRVERKPYCLVVETKDRRMWLSLKSDEEVFGWKDDIYVRSPLMGFSNPVNFRHKIHVGFDPTTRNFTGLPDSWARLLNSSAITREDYKRNPQAIIEALGFYTEHKQQAFEEQGMTATPMSLSASNIPPPYSPDPVTTAPPRFGAGTGFAGASGGRGPPSLSQTTLTRDTDGTLPGRPSLSRNDSGTPLWVDPVLGATPARRHPSILATQGRFMDLQAYRLQDPHPLVLRALARHRNRK